MPPGVGRPAIAGRPAVDHFVGHLLVDEAELLVELRVDPFQFTGQISEPFNLYLRGHGSRSGGCVGDRPGSGVEDRPVPLTVGVRFDSEITDHTHSRQYSPASVAPAASPIWSEKAMGASETKAASSSGSFSTDTWPEASNAPTFCPPNVKA